MKMPIIPRSKFDPVQTNKEEVKAIKEFKVRIKEVGDRLIERVEQLRFIKYPSKIRNNSYAFLLDENELNALLGLLEADLLTYLIADQWLYHQYIEPTYKRGTLLAKANLRHQSGVQAPFFTPQGMLNRRFALTRTRVFEDMKNLSSSMKANLARILSEGIANGNSIRSITTSIKEQLEITESRAATIARTEISTAMKRARIDEAEEAQDQLGFTIMMMQISALSPTTRWWHAAAHGTMRTIEETREWLSESKNAINCKCTFVEVLVDSLGNPISNILEMRVKDMKFESAKLVKELKAV